MVFDEQTAGNGVVLTGIVAKVGGLISAVFGGILAMPSVFGQLETFGTAPARARGRGRGRGRGIGCWITLVGSTMVAAVQD